ncbi:MAG: hypothetical protein IJQ11_12925 [Bacteroidales bacterium]|nr:hypothetical protein [Bacteroidales bacterium]
MTTTHTVMGLYDTLDDRLKALSEAEFQYIESNDISCASELDHNCTGIYMEATVIYFAIKNPIFIIKEHGRRKMAQIHTIFHEVISTIAKQNGCFVNCYSPEAFLILCPGKEDNVSVAVRTAMKIAFALSDTYKPLYANIPNIEFSMGIDHGHVLGKKSLTEIGSDRITWFGMSIYKAKAISKESARPYHIGVASIVFNNLEESLKTKEKRILGIKKTVELWTKVSYMHENSKKHYYQTNHKLDFKEET